MLKRLFKQFAMLSTILVFLAAASFAAKSHQPSEASTAEMMSADARQPLDGVRQTPLGTVDDVFLPACRMGFTPASPDSFIGHQVGSTWYDYQHNGSMGRQIARGADGRIHFSWTYKADGTPGNSERFVYYNSAIFSGGAWTNSHGVSGTGIPELGAGYTTIDAFNSRALVTWHQPAPGGGYRVSVGWDVAPGAGEFPTVAAPVENCSGASSNGSDDVYLWPILHADSDTGSISDPIIHIVACEAAPATELLRSMVYHRGSGPGFTYFGACGVYIDSIATISPVVRQDPNSDQVALVWLKPIDQNEATANQYNNDVVYCESLDRGLSWGSEINVTQYQPQDQERAFSNLSAMYSSDGCLHIVWDAPFYNHADGTVSTMANKLYHWDDCSDCISLVLAADNFQSCLPGRWNYNATKQNISECDGKLYLTYTYFAGDVDAGTQDCSAGGYANGEIYAQVSLTGGVTWGPPVNLSNTPDNGCVAGGCESEHWSSAVMYSSDSLYILYVGDTDAGGWAGGDEPEGVATESPLMFMTYPCFSTQAFASLSPEPQQFLYPLTARPAEQQDTTLALINSGISPASFDLSVSYSSGSDWLFMTPTSGQVGVGCNNSSLVTVSFVGPAEEGLYQAEIEVSYDAVRSVLHIPVELYCFETFFAPENGLLRTEHSQLLVRQVGRLAAQEVGVGFNWFADSSDFLFDASLILGTDRDDLSFNIFHQMSDVGPPENPWKRLYALSPTLVDSSSYVSYRHAHGAGCNHDSTIAFTSEYYASKQADRGGFYVAHFNLYAGPNFSSTIESLIVAFAADWDIPSDTNADNLGGVNQDLLLVYQQGQYSGSPEQNDAKFGGIAYRGDDSASLNAAAGFIWENDRYVYPDDGYHVDSLATYLRLAEGWQATPADSIEDLNCIIVIRRDAALAATDTISFNIIVAGANSGLKSLADLESAVAMAESFICDYVTPDAPYCPDNECFCGDADGNGVWNISDAVFLLAYIFGDGPAPDRYCLGDADGNTVINISDIVYLVTYIFGDGLPPHCPEAIARS